MSANEILIHNFQSIRKRSMKLWLSMDEELLFWRPNPASASSKEIVRLVLKTELLHFAQLTQPAFKIDFNIIFSSEFSSVENELRQSQVYHEKFLKHIYSYKQNVLDSIIKSVDNTLEPLSISEYLLMMMRQESEYYGLLQAYSRLFKGEKIAA